METDRHYFVEGLFIIGLAVAAAVFLVWLQNTGQRDDVLYRIHFDESVSGLALGDPVRFHGVDVGTVKVIGLDATDPRKVQVDVRLRKNAPIKTDTKATLKLKGITGVVFIELSGGAPNAKPLVSVTPEGQIPEIASEKSPLTTVLDELPRILAKFSAIEDQTKKVETDISDVAGKIKHNPLLGLGSTDDKADAKPASSAPQPRLPHSQ
jgi:phospholipid/cholesterol/gamma-HCH transport system substrate-binding protein